MLIGIDGNEANTGERVGVNVWAYEVLKGLRGIRGKRGIRWMIYLSRPPRADMPEEGENWKYRVIGPGGLWTRWRLPLDLYFHRFKGFEGSDPSALTEGSDPLRRPDVFLSLSHYAPKWVPPRGSTRRAPMPRVVCIMDLSFLKFPEAFKPAVRWQLTNWTRESVRKAAHVITISEFNKQEIIKNYGCDEKKVTVVYPGTSEIFKGLSLRTQGESLREKYGISGRYLLFVGTLQPKKNLGRLIEAFGMVRKRFREVELVIAGKVWSQFSNEIATSSRPKVGAPRNDGVENGVRYLGFVAEKDLPGLVAGAEGLIIPSLYEGFGIPAVEAMSMGTPVLASNVTSLPEIIGDVGILFDPYDIKDMADKICRLLNMTKIQRQDLVKKGMIRAESFSWDKAADSIMRSLLAAVQGDSSPDDKNER